MVLISNAKINLTLKVNSKSKNNLHEIQSFFCLIDLADKIRIKSINKQKDKIIFKGPFAKSINKSDNSILKILKLLRKLRLISNFYSVIIYKNIPIFAGLGGGSGNAASILKYLLKKKVNKSLLNQAERIIGSDLKLFFHKQGFLKNIDSITNFKKKQKLFFLLIKPNIKCSTKEIYSKVKNYSRKQIFKENIINNKKKFLSFLSNSNNDLQLIVEKKHPIINELLINIRNQEGCYLSRMTGSGSVCFGLFSNQIKAKKGLYNLKMKYPKFWASLAKTV